MHTTRAAARVRAVIRGFWAMRVTRSRMLVRLPVMVVAVWNRAAGCRPAAIMFTRVWP